MKPGMSLIRHYLQFKDFPHASVGNKMVTHIVVRNFCFIKIE